MDNKIDMIQVVCAGNNGDKQLIIDVKHGTDNWRLQGKSHYEREYYANISQYWYERLGVAHGNR